MFSSVNILCFRMKFNLDFDENDMQEILLMKTEPENSPFYNNDK